MTNNKIFMAMVGVISLGFVGWTLWTAHPDGHARPPLPAAAATDRETPPATSQPAPVSMWNVSETTDDVTGEVTKVADDSLGSESIVVRKKGKKLEAYINTGEFLETMENVETGV